MQPFDLSRALAGDPVITRDGRKVNEIHYFKTCNTAYCIVAIIDNQYYEFTKTGKFTIFQEPHDIDLFMDDVKKIKKLFIAINLITNEYYSHSYNDKSKLENDCRKQFKEGTYKISEITFEESS